MIQSNTYFDEIFYSRQLAILGEETQQKLGQMRCFIQGLRGLGLEIAKNLILSGPKSVIIYDPTLITITDLGSNFYASIDQVGKVTRQDSVIKQLQELNPYVTVEIYNGQLTGETLSEFSVVVLTDVWDQKYITEVNEAVRAKGHGFILAHSSGLFGSIFVDFSDKFQVLDSNGEEPNQLMVSHITNEIDGIVTTTDDQRKGFSDGDYVTFKEVIGMTELNDKVFKIRVISPYQFHIGDTSNFSKYINNGIVTQVKVPQEIQFKSFQSSLTHSLAPEKNELNCFDGGKFGIPQQLHIVYNAILQFVNQNEGKGPRLLNYDDAQTIWELTQQINNQVQNTIKVDLDEQLVKNISLYFQTQITQQTSFWGGIVALEIIKYTGKFTPIRQWLHNEFYEALPEQQVNRTLKNCQYDDYIAIFGQEALEKLQSSKIFIVGAGALGCEYIKMFALMGCGSQQQGEVSVTDNDNIELSNLNRQFLFRNHNIGSNKAIIACQAGQQINNETKFKSYPLRVEENSKATFNDDFWENQDFIVNAVDNVKTRFYIDNKCCTFGKPTFESGTLGTKCSSQIIIPQLTQTYNEIKDPAENSTPLDKIKNFPNNIEDAIPWAIDCFQEIFVNKILECIQFIGNPQYYLKQININIDRVFKTEIQSLKEIVQLSLNPKLKEISIYVKNIFNQFFCNKINDLLVHLPADKKNYSGELFWSNPKRIPSPIFFDQADQLHQTFMLSAVNIFLSIFGMAHVDTFGEIYQFLQSKQIEQQEENSKFENDLEKNQVLLIISELEQIVAQMPKETPKLNKCCLNLEDPSNLHCDFLTATTNLRARNYRISETTPLKVIIKAGNITPYLSSTTSVIVGAVGLEIFKFALQKKIFKNFFINLAQPIFLIEQASPPKQCKDEAFHSIFLSPKKSIPPNWTAWDFIVTSQKMTLQQFLDYFKQNYNIAIKMIIYDKCFLYNSFIAQQNDILDKEIETLCIEKLKKEIPKYMKFLVLQISGEFENDGESISADVPQIKYILK